MYQAQQGAAGSEAAGGSADDGVVDAEFEDVSDAKKSA
jgi:hypothetical protein